jgi:hypothetical protein
MSALSSVGMSGLSPADYANEPASIAHGDAAAKSAYSEGLGFESMLMSQITQQMTQTISSSDPSDASSSSDPTDASSDASSGGQYSSLMSSALTQGIMSGGDNGLAMQIAQSIDPALLGKAS